MKTTLYILAGMLILIGGVWILQGVNILPGSFMTGQIEWAFAGVASLIIGGILFRSARGR